MRRGTKEKQRSGISGSCGDDDDAVTRKDHFRNTYVRGIFKVTNVASMIQETRLRRSGHTLRSIRKCEKKDYTNGCTWENEAQSANEHVETIGGGRLEVESQLQLEVEAPEFLNATQGRFIRNSDPT